MGGILQERVVRTVPCPLIQDLAGSCPGQVCIKLGCVVAFSSEMVLCARGLVGALLCLDGPRDAHIQILGNSAEKYAINGTTHSFLNMVLVVGDNKMLGVGEVGCAGMSRDAALSPSR